MAIGAGMGAATAAPINGAAKRDANDVLAGVIRMSIGGVRREMPVLVAAKSRIWKGDLVKAIGSVSLPPDSQFSIEWATNLAQLVADKIVELLVSYDQTYALSGASSNDAAAQWLLDNATDPELYAAFIEVLKATFPFVNDPRQMVLEMLGDAMREQAVVQGALRAQQIVEQAMTTAQPPSSGPSTTGAASEAPATSSSTGRTSRSSISSKKASSGNGARQRRAATD